MPEYLAPGVFVEETSFRSKSIEGVSTSTTAFVGPTRSGPIADATPELLTSFADFERIYGGLNRLAIGQDGMINYLAHAASAYFNEGGARLYVVRVGGGTAAASTEFGAGKSKFEARFLGDSGNGRVLVAMNKNRITKEAAEKVIEGSLIITKEDGPEAAVKVGGVWVDAGDRKTSKPLPDEGFLVTVNVTAIDKDGASVTFDGLGLDRAHKRFIGDVLHQDGNGRADGVSRWIKFNTSDSVNPQELLTEFKPGAGDSNKLPREYILTDGTDALPTGADYGAALNVVAGLDDVSIVAAPGHTENANAAKDVRLRLISHAESRRSYRIAVLDMPRGQSPVEAQKTKGEIDSKYAAIYYPWVVAPNPLFDPNNPVDDAELVLPPSGFVCGIYARSDIERGVHKAPANEVIRGALRFERLITTGEQELLNPLGVNCLRYFPGRGHRVWGARTTTSDPEWKYVSDRRYFNYLEHSIDRGTQWAVFEPNGQRLWANVRDTVAGFLYNEWFNGALLGDKPEQGFFVKCDRSTMTQNDLDNGRLICLIGVAVIKPAEFVVFRIGQKTADARS